MLNVAKGQCESVHTKFVHVVLFPISPGCNHAGEAKEPNDHAGQRDPAAHKHLINQHLRLCTCTSTGHLVTDVHQAVGTGIPQAPKGLSLQLFPR